LRTLADWRCGWQVDGRRWVQRLRQSRSKLVNLRATLSEGSGQLKGAWVPMDEDIFVEVEVDNPLQVALQLDDLTLTYLFQAAVPQDQYASASGADKLGTSAGSAPASSGAAIASAGAAIASAGAGASLADEASGAGNGLGGDQGLADCVEIERKSLNLAAGARYVVRIRLVARRAGTLRLTGLSWKLAGAVCCVRELSLKGKRLQASLAQRCAPQGVYEEDRRALIRVVPPMPRVTLELLGLPSRALHGQVMR
jgi:hypothetical protein